MKYANQLYILIQQLQTKMLTEEDPTKKWGLFRRIKKYQKLYNTCVSDEIHTEIMARETTTRGFYGRPERNTKRN